MKEVDNNRILSINKTLPLGFKALTLDTVNINSKKGGITEGWSYWVNLELEEWVGFGWIMKKESKQEEEQSLISQNWTELSTYYG